MKLSNILKNLSTVRTENKVENNSVLSNFVKPPFYEAINLCEINQSIALVGSRGSGKTVYLKYFSHWTQFDKNICVTHDKLSSLVFYWKPDTLTCRTIEKTYRKTLKAQKMFQNYVCLEITKEIINLIKNVSYHFSNEINDSEINKFLKTICRFLKIEFNEQTQDVTLDYVLDEISFLSTTLDDAAENNSLINMNAGLMIREFIRKIRKINIFSNSSFKIYIDEFENLTFDQQSYINGLRKHSDNVLSWNVAYKAYANTSSLVAVNEHDGEKLQQPNDFRELNLDSVLSNADTKLVSGFFAKILLVAIDKETYSQRQFDECLEETNKIFNNVSNSEIIDEYFKSNTKNFKRVLNELDDLKKSINNNEVFKKIEQNPTLAVALTIIKEHRNFNLDTLIGFLEDSDTLSEKEKNSFKEKIKHYTLAGAFKLNITSSYMSIPIYAGFDKMMIISSFNIRFFLELCYQSILLHFKSIDIDTDISIQNLYAIERSTVHKACIDTSTGLRRDIISFAPMGQKLSRFTLRLGEIFKIKHQLPPISEPEINHFSLPTEPTGKLEEFLNQALCWNVLIAHDVTKNKEEIDKNHFDYRLNPIYCPSFGISYNKKHKILLTELDLEILTDNNYDKWLALRKRYESKSIINNSNGDLFDAM